MSNDSWRTKTSIIRDGSIRMTHPRHGEFTNISTSAWQSFCIAKSFMITFFPRKLFYGST
jgi:hypothetical protein